MGSKIMMAPNPFRGMGIDRVVVLGETDTGLIVLSVDAINKYPEIIKRYKPIDYWAISFWNWIWLAFFIGGIVLAFLRSWWFLPLGFVLGVLVIRGNHQTSADVAVTIARESEEARKTLAGRGIIWEAPRQSVVSP